MKKGLLLVVALLALSGLMAAMAYSDAMVSNQVSAALVETDVAFLAVVKNPLFDDFATIKNGQMVIDFTKAGVSGFQPNSNYNFNDLFYVKNNLDKTVKMGMRFSQIYPTSAHTWIPGLHGISTNKPTTYTADGTGYQNDLVFASSANQFTSGWYEGRYIELAPGESVGIDWRFVVDNITNFAKGTWTLQVFGDVVGR